MRRLITIARFTANGRMTRPRTSMTARMELIDLLSKQGKKQELLAELISLEAELSRESPGIRKRLANLFLAADSPARAAEIYQAMAAKDPKDVAAYEGLGRSGTGAGTVSAPRMRLSSRLFRQHPDNASIRSHLQTLNTVVALDPTLRQLTSEEKYRRSRRILEMARIGLAQCAARILWSVADESAADAATLPARKPRRMLRTRLAEKVLGSGGSGLAHAEPRRAAELPAADEDALRLMMKKLALVSVWRPVILVKL